MNHYPRYFYHLLLKMIEIPISEIKSFQYKKMDRGKSIINSSAILLLGVYFLIFNKIFIFDSFIYEIITIFVNI